jgi:hypothetical protein
MNIAGDIHRNATDKATRVTTACENKMAINAFGNWFEKSDDTTYAILRELNMSQ